VRLRAVSWNIHGCVGRDRRFDPLRVAHVLQLLRPDVALLQEVGDARDLHPPIDQAQTIADVLELSCAVGITMRGDGPHGYGNATLSRLPMVGQESYDLSVRGREPRLCLRAELAGGLVTLNVHLGLGPEERRRQLRFLIERAGPIDDHGPPLVLAGDFNDVPPGPVTLTLAARLLDAGAFARRRATYPSAWPFLRLDRLYVSRRVGLCGSFVDRSPLARAASDHLPLVVDALV
jgi:endonuclease/exonuclease/phosphatase family metal-dependent hydrolase